MSGDLKRKMVIGDRELDLIEEGQSESFLLESEACRSIEMLKDNRLFRIVTWDGRIKYAIVDQGNRTAIVDASEALEVVRLISWDMEQHRGNGSLVSQLQR